MHAHHMQNHIYKLKENNSTNTHVFYGYKGSTVVNMKETATG